jgi:hypothetical protein
MSEPERSYGAGEDIPGTPSPFPFVLTSNASTVIAVLSILVTLVTETDSWFPFSLWGFPGLYWFAVLAALATGTMALMRKPWRGWRSIAGILAWLIILSPVFPVALVLLFLARH